MGRFSREKGKRGELDIVHCIPGAKRTGLCGVKTIVDVTWPGGAAQVKNTSAIGGAAIARNLELLETAAPDKKVYVLIKPRRGEWIICQRFNQWLEEGVE